MCSSLYPLYYKLIKFRGVRLYMGKTIYTLRFLSVLSSYYLYDHILEQCFKDVTGLVICNLFSHDSWNQRGNLLRHHFCCSEGQKQRFELEAGNQDFASKREPIVEACKFLCVCLLSPSGGLEKGL